MVYMKKESKRSCTTKGVDCEDDSAICRYATAIEDNLFYSSIKLMPSTEETKKDLTREP
jgi:hypothetical protein